MRYRIIAWILIVGTFLACASKLDDKVVTEVREQPPSPFIVSTDYQIEMVNDFISGEAYYKGYVLIIYSSGESNVVGMYEVRSDSTKTMYEAHSEAMLTGYKQSKELMKSIRKQRKR